MNYRATKVMSEYRSETEKLLFSLPLAGSAFRKVYWDRNLARECAMYVPAEDYVVSYATSDLSTCERGTHIMKRTPNWVRKNQLSGFYREVELPAPTAIYSDTEQKKNELKGQDPSIDTDNRHTLLEMQVDVDLPGFEHQRGGNETGMALPYVITIDQQSNTVLAIYRNWKEGDEDYIKRDHVVHYTYLPGLGFYGFGLVHIIGGLTKSATSLLRQLVDSGTLANLPGGLKARGLMIKGDDTPIAPGEWRDVDLPGTAIKDNILPLPYKEPSTVLYQLLGDLVNEGRRFASAGDVKAADMNAEAPVGTTLAILEREMKVLSAVQARVHASMGKELQMLAELVQENGPEEYPYDVGGEFTIAEDFDERIDVIPVSDPNAGTMAQRIMQYQAALQLAATAPQMYDMPRLHRQMLETLGIQEAEKIVPTEDDMVPKDPVTENMDILNGEPVKAHLYQDHEAHIQTHMMAAQNPEMQKIIQQHPNAEALKGAMMAHISEHVGMGYRHRIEQELGMPMPGPDEPLPEDIELRLSRLVAPAAAQLTGKAQQQAEAEKNAEMQKDPLIQLQEREQALKEKTQQDKKESEDKKLLANAVKEAERLRIENERLVQKGNKDAADTILRALELELSADAQDEQLKSKEMTDGYKIGLEFAQRIINQNNMG
jgi:hypothetical protein